MAESEISQLVQIPCKVYPRVVQAKKESPIEILKDIDDDDNI